MKRAGVISTAFLSFLLLGATAFGYPQPGPQQDKNKEQQQKQDKQSQRGQQQNRSQQPQRAQQQQQNRNTQQRAQNQQQQRQNTQQRAQNQQQQRQNTQQRAQQQQQTQNTQHAQQQRSQQQRNTQQGEQRGDWQQHRAQNFASEHRTWQQRGGYDGERIPDAYYRSHYGEGHLFRVYSLPFMYVGGDPRFQYDGYWFSVMDPIPEYWASNWYQNDDMYVNYYDNGYYLYDRRYPGRPGLAISISF